jgi:nucleoside-diphosphate-sugar epimerase
MDKKQRIIITGGAGFLGSYLVEKYKAAGLAEGRGQRAEVRGQRAEVRGQRSEVRGQRSEVRGQSLCGAAVENTV